MDVFSGAFDAARVAILVKDADGDFVAANQACAELFGYTPTEFARIGGTDLTHPEDRERTTRFLDEFRRSEARSAEIEKRYRHKDGTAIWARVTVSKLIDGDGRLTHVIASIEDVTAGRATEERLRRSEEQFRLLVENVADAFWLTSPNYDKTYFVSPTVETILGVTAQEIFANPAAGFGSLHPDDVERALVHAPRTREEPCEIQLRVQPVSRGMRWIRCRSFPIFDSEGDVDRIAWIIEDVTTKRQAAELLEQARKHAADFVRAASDPLQVLQSTLGPGGDNGAPPGEPALTASDEQARIDYETRVASLTRRERQVMELMVRASSTRDIARILNLAGKTIEGYRAQVKKKMQVKSLAELVRLSLLTQLPPR